MSYININDNESIKSILNTIIIDTIKNNEKLIEKRLGESCGYYGEYGIDTKNGIKLVIHNINGKNLDMIYDEDRLSFKIGKYYYNIFSSSELSYVLYNILYKSLNGEKVGSTVSIIDSIFNIIDDFDDDDLLD